MAKEPIPQTEVVEAVAAVAPDVRLEPDRSWLWVIEPDLAPLHKKCTCPECTARAAKRELLKATGFRFAFKPHVLPSGKTARWGHSCTKPTPFRKKGKKGKPGRIDPLETTHDDGFDMEEAKAFFNQS